MAPNWSIASCKPNTSHNRRSVLCDGWAAMCYRFLLKRSDFALASFSQSSQAPTRLMLLYGLPGR